jgi:hypothetical protein
MTMYSQMKDFIALQPKQSLLPYNLNNPKPKQSLSV